MILQKELRTSVNVELDMGQESFFRNYLPTPSHADSIIGMAEGFTNENTNSAHIMIGPYGSGKSLLATVLASIVSKKIDDKTIKELTNKFKKVHQNVYEHLKTLNSLDLKYIPIILNGSYQDFGNNLVEKIQQQLEIIGLKIELPTERNNIIKIIEDWEKNYLDTYEKLQILIEKKFSTIDNFKYDVLNGSLSRIQWFKSNYPTLTSGANFNANNKGDFNQNLHHILDVLQEEKIGLFIVHDEFGRFLQELEQNAITKTMQELQDIAEFVSRSNNYIQLLLISHKGMSQYMKGFNAEFQSEFQRIEKRYSSYYVESDSATYFRIMENYLTINNFNKNTNTNLLNKLREFNLFPELNNHEIENLIVKGCSPVHPVTLYLLPRISRLFGQNERTLFTYLDSNEPASLHKELETQTKYVYADSLFDFFFTPVKLNEKFEGESKEIIDTYLSIISDLDARKTSAIRVIKFITLWKLTNSNNIYKLDKNLIAFTTGIPEKRLDEILKELVSFKHIRYNIVQKTWELYEGSSLYVQELIEEKKYEVGISLNDRLNVIDKSISKRYYLSRDYNEEKSMTRFMKVQLINSTAFISKTYNEETSFIEKSDGTINHILLDNIQDFPKVLKKIEGYDNPDIIFSVMKKDVLSIKEAIESHIIINHIQEDISLLSEFKNLKNELDVLKEDYFYEIQQFSKSITNFDSNVEWYHKGKQILIYNELELENIASDIMFEVYPETPIIMNDLINRFNVTGIQKRSIKDVINHALNSFYEENIGIDGQGPSYLIYATIIKNNNINLKELNQIDNVYFNNMRHRLVNYIEKNTKGKLIEIYNILNRPPFGIRPPLISLIASVLLRDKWNQIMFYRNDMYIPALEGEKIHEMFKEAPEYDYVYHNYSGEMIKYMNFLENKLEEYIGENVKNSTQLIKVSSALLNWLRNLPKQTQITNTFISPDQAELKEIIRKSEINPLETLNSLIEFTDGDYCRIENLMMDLEKSNNEFKIIVQERLNELLQINSFEQKSDFIERWDNARVIKNKLASVLNNNTNFEQFIYHYIGTELKDWSDITFELFESQIINDIEQLQSNRIIDDNSYELYIDDSYKVVKKVDLSKKSEVIYNNLDRMVKNAGRNVPKEEINYLLLKLLQEYIE